LSKLLLIDGDQYLFTCTAAAEDEVRFNVELGEPNWDEPPIHVIFSNPVRARELFDEAMERLFERFETREHFLCFSTPPDFRFGKDAQPNFRLGVDATYKNNRQLSRKPLCYAQLRGDIETDYRCKNFIGLEADDVMGIVATSPKIKAQRIIVSQDKDMKTIPTTVWNGKDLVTYSEDEANYWHLYQTLVGDITDGYKGCPGVGAVKAEKLLKAMPEGPIDPEISHGEWMWWQVLAAYEKAGLTEADAITQARLARILRWSDWDNEKKEPILWTPGAK
jgi:5'-3' exonuclease